MKYMLYSTNTGTFTFKPWRILNLHFILVVTKQLHIKGVGPSTARLALAGQPFKTMANKVVKLIVVFLAFELNCLSSENAKLKTGL